MTSIEFLNLFTHLLFIANNFWQLLSIKAVTMLVAVQQHCPFTCACKQFTQVAELQLSFCHIFLQSQTIHKKTSRQALTNILAITLSKSDDVIKASSRHY